MRHRVLWLPLGLAAAVLLIAGWKSARMALVDMLVGAEVYSLPGDRNTGEAKIPFQRELDPNLPAGFFTSSLQVNFADAREARIETVTVRFALPAGQAPSVSVQTYDADGVGVGHQIALTHQGSYKAGPITFNIYGGTHAVRLLSQAPANQINAVTPITVFARRSGTTTGQATVRVTLSGYTTPGGGGIDG